jgi:type IV pilus assembly protein PilX
MVVVLVLLSVMLLGGMALARMTEVGTLASGQRGLPRSLAAGLGGRRQHRLPGGARTDQREQQQRQLVLRDPAGAGRQRRAHGQLRHRPEVVVGAYSVRYVVDRVCTGALPVTDPLRQCLVKQVPQIESSTDREKPDPPTARQFRITVRVTGPKDTQAWVQALITKG